MSHGRNSSSQVYSQLNSSLSSGKNKSAEEKDEANELIPDLYKCPIGLGLMNKPMMVLPCRHNVDEAALGDWQAMNRGHATCPCCRGRIEKTIPNVELKEAIDIYKKEHKEALEYLRLQAEHKKLISEHKKLAVENAKLATEGQGVKTLLTKHLKDEKNPIGHVMDLPAHNHAKMTLMLENILAKLKGKVRAIELRRITAKCKAQKLIKKLSVTLKDKKTSLEKLSNKFKNEHQVFRQLHISAFNQIDNAFDEKNSARVNEFSQLANNWKAHSEQLQKDRLQLTTECTSINKATKRVVSYYFKRIKGFNQSINETKAEMKTINDYKIKILNDALVHAKKTASKLPVLFQGAESQSSLVSVKKPKHTPEVQAQFDKQLYDLLEKNAEYSLIKNALEKGASPNINRPIPLPLLKAIYNAKPNIVQLLLQHGAVVDDSRNIAWETSIGSNKFKNHVGTTPLIFAVKLHHCHQYVPAYKENIPQIIDHLVKAHVNVNAADSEEMTALHWAAYFNDITMVLKLLSANADVNKLSKGKTAYDIAKMNNASSTVLEILTQAMEGRAEATLSVSLPVLLRR